MLKRRTGFTIMEVLVALVLVVTLSAVMLPLLAKQLRTSNAAALAQNVQLIASAVNKFREDMGFYPHDLVQLATQPNASENLNSCAFVESSTFEGWRGPYLSFPVTALGIKIGDATINNLLTRNPPDNTSTAIGVLNIEVAEVHKPIANQVDSLIDGTSNLLTGANSGSVTWNSSGSGNMGDFAFSIPIRNC